MTSEATTENAETEPANPPTPEPDETQKRDDEVLSKNGLKALQAERKRGNDLEAELRQLRADLDATKDTRSELEKASETAAKVAAELEAMKLDNLRLRVAGDAKLSGELQEFLTGSDEATIRRQAEKLASIASTKRPQPDPAQGATQGNPAQTQLSRTDLIGKPPEWILEQLKNGRLDDVRGVTA